MKTINCSDFRKLKKGELEAIKPVIITFDGLPIGLFCSPDKVIVLEDLHIRVQNMLRAQEKRARIGMPKTE